MKFSPSRFYKEFARETIAGEIAVAWIATERDDNIWDKFLQETPLGQFQQSTIWARAKEVSSWTPVRGVLTLDDEIVGGFQILRRSYWWGRIGYVSKGPVILPDYPLVAEYATKLLRKLVRVEKLTALLVQPPDRCEQMSKTLASEDFDLNVLTGVNEATWIIDLRDGFEAIEKRMSKWTRKKVKQAKNRSVSIREGAREDIGTFFQLMLSTCRRQGVEPVPGDEKTLCALWDASKPHDCIRLAFAECEGKPLAGLLCILFGQTVSLWKKGWTSTDGQRHPNELLTYELLRWANSSGYQLADFCAVDVGIAHRMLRGEALSPGQENSRHSFNIRFGGSARLLPEARVYFPNPLMRLAYRVIFHKKIAQAEEECKLGRGLANKCGGLKYAGIQKQ